MTTGASDGNTGNTDNTAVGALGAGIGQVPTNWDFESDVVIIGAGATGLPAW